MTNHLQIERSLNGARWKLADAEVDVAQVARIMRSHDVPEVIARLLCARAIPEDQIAAFLNPTLKEHFPDPLSMAGMEALANDLAEAIEDEKQIAIFGDFDVDGATSSAVMYHFLKYCGIEPRIYIPARLTEGYGPNNEALDTLRAEGAEVLLMLDCGTTAFDTLEYGASIGLKIAVLDHHEAEDRLPNAWHVINPKRKDDISGLDVLAAVGVTFMVCVATNAALRKRGFYARDGVHDAPLKSLLDLVALGTVCDMVPLKGINRLLVRAGFDRMNRAPCIGLRALADVARINAPFTPYHAGFVFGPRVNAGSRVGQSDMGAQLFCSDDEAAARDMAWTLNDCNDKRKAMQMDMEREALVMVEAQGLDQNPVIIVGAEGWHSGLSGLVAGRIKEKYNKPACVMTSYEAEDGTVEWRGSGRSIAGIHIAQAFIDARTEGLLEKGGGHAMAGGFTALADQLETFKSFMLEHIDNQMKSGDVHIETLIDGVLSVRGAQPAFIEMIHTQLGPFGQEHPEPLFALPNVRVHSADIVGEAHIRLMVSDWEGGTRIKAMAFRAVGTPLGDALLTRTNAAFHLTGHMKVDRWQGNERTEMHIRDGVILNDMG